MDQVVEKLRAEFSRSDAIRDAGLTTPRDILRHDDIPYGEDPKWLSLDLYQPREAVGRLTPVIVSVHGGGWVYGDKALYQYYCMNLAQRGFSVVNFTYRLAPEFKYPAPIEDTNAVFRWVMEHAPEYGLDTGRLFAVGDSAGAQLLSLYACACTNPGYAKRYAFEVPEGLKLRAVGLACGVYEMDVSEGGQDRHLAEALLPGGVTPEAMALLTPLPYITPDFPPTFVFTSTGDFLRAQPARLIGKLQENDVPFLYRLYGDRKNRPGHVFHCDLRSPVGQLCNDEQCDFFRRFC